MLSPLEADPGFDIFCAAQQQNSHCVACEYDFCQREKEEERGKGMQMATQLPDPVGSNQYASSALVPTTRFIQNSHPLHLKVSWLQGTFFPPHPQRDS